MSGISGWSAYSYYSTGWNPWSRTNQTNNAAQTPAVMATQRAAQPETPVQPVAPVQKASPAAGDQSALGLPIRQGADPVEMAVRMRIQYGNDPAAAEQNAELKLPESQSPQEVMEEGECQTCKERKYQDGSDDPGVSFKTPTNVAPDQAAAAVRGHENEHVAREQAKAKQEDRKVVSQSVTYHTNICPECGKVYISGGTTRTITKANTQPDAVQQAEQQQTQRVPFSAVA